MISVLHFYGNIGFFNNCNKDIHNYTKVKKKYTINIKQNM